MRHWRRLTVARDPEVAPSQKPGWLTGRRRTESALPTNTTEMELTQEHRYQPATTKTAPERPLPLEGSSALGASQTRLPMGEAYRRHFKAQFPFLLTEADRDDFLDRICSLPIPLSNEDEDLRFDHSDLDDLSREEMARELAAAQIRLTISSRVQPWIVCWLVDRTTRLRERLAHA